MNRHHIEKAAELDFEATQLEMSIARLKNLAEEDSLCLATHGGNNSYTLSKEEFGSLLNELIAREQAELDKILKEIEGL